MPSFNCISLKVNSLFSSGLFAALLLAGCEKAQVFPPVYPVQGKVAYDGRPTPGAFVVFHPKGNSDKNAPRPSGYVDKDGVFHLTTFKSQDGAPPGEYVVTVELRQIVKKGDDVELGPNELPTQYSAPNTSTLVAKVAEAPSNDVPLDLKR